MEENNDLFEIDENNELLAWVKVLLFFAGVASTVILILAGVKMMGIESVSGDSIAEEYYHLVGLACIGLGCFTGPLLTCLVFKL